MVMYFRAFEEANISAFLFRIVALFYPVTCHLRLYSLLYVEIVCIDAFLKEPA